MSFVIVSKNAKSAPTESQLTTAMVNAGGVPISCEGNNTSRKLTFTGIVGHTKFQNEMRIIVPGSSATSWYFDWADTTALAISTPENQDLSDDLSASNLLTLAVAATKKSVKIVIDSADLTSLKSAKYRLCFAKKVGDAAYNVVWQSSEKYLVNNSFSWVPQYQLFGSSSFEDNITVNVSTNIVTIGLGETSILNKVGHLGYPSTGGNSTSITLQNNYGLIHPGVSQISTNIDGTTSVTPIYVAKNPSVLGNTVLTPIEKVLVWFEKNIGTSTMFSDSRSLAVEIDLTSADAATRLYSNGVWSTP